MIGKGNEWLTYVLVRQYSARCSTVQWGGEIQYGGTIRRWNRAGRTVCELALQYLRAFLSISTSSWLERGWFRQIIQCFSVHPCCLCDNLCIIVILWWKTWKNFRVTMSSSWHVYLCRVWRFSLRVRSEVRVCARKPVCAHTERAQWWIAFPWMCR